MNANMATKVDSPMSFHISGAAEISSAIIAIGSTHFCARWMGSAMRVAASGQRALIAIPAPSGASTDMAISSPMAPGLETSWRPKMSSSNIAAMVSTGTTRTARMMTRPRAY